MIDITKLDWIKINIPWRMDYFKPPPRPDHEITKEFYNLNNIKTASEFNFLRNDEELINKYSDQFESENPGFQSWEYSPHSSPYPSVKFMNWCKNNEDNSLKEIAKKCSFHIEWNSFYKNHPLNKNYIENFKQLKEEHNNKSFCGRGLNKPGTLVKFEDKIILLGSVVKDEFWMDIPRIKNKTIVLEYVTLLNLEELCGDKYV